MKKTGITLLLFSIFSIVGAHSLRQSTLLKVENNGTLTYQVLRAMCFCVVLLMEPNRSAKVTGNGHSECCMLIIKKST